ncbi:thiamine phosphate synthase [Parapedobacter deserti]|uniref:Thiamine-phosphate synthase n=1 Tax=Parapedobacter deserti TaxID=1912957 RepID=A0ABV7JNI0_9SPHI
MKKIDSFHYITHPLTDYPIARQVDDVCRCGCTWIQLRLKQSDTEERLDTALSVYPVLKRYNAKLIINDDVHVALAADADGVHIGARDMHPSDARHMLGPNKIIGCTANTLDDVLRLSQYDIDYIGVGPFRFTSTKEKLSPVLGREGIHRIVAAARIHGVCLPIIAIGGIMPRHIAAVMETGVHGIAVSGAICGADDPSAASQAIMKQLADYRSPTADHQSPKR